MSNTEAHWVQKTLHNIRPLFSLNVKGKCADLTGSKTQIKCLMQRESLKIGDERGKNPR